MPTSSRCQLESWWRENPFLSGVHWTSGIEIGLRLIAWTWIRRLLATWPGVKSLFDENPRRAATDPLASALPGALPQRRLVREQPRDRRGRGPARRRVRAALVPGKRALEGRRRRAARGGASTKHLRDRNQPGARVRIPRVRRHARARGRSRVRRGSGATRRRHVARSLRHGRRRCRHRRRRACARRGRATATMPGCWPSTATARDGRRSSRSGARCSNRCRWWPEVPGTVVSTLLATLAQAPERSRIVRRPGRRTSPTRE